MTHCGGAVAPSQASDALLLPSPNRAEDADTTVATAGHGHHGPQAAAAGSNGGGPRRGNAAGSALKTFSKSFGGSALNLALGVYSNSKVLPNYTADDDEAGHDGAAGHVDVFAAAGVAFDVKPYGAERPSTRRGVRQFFVVVKGRFDSYHEMTWGRPPAGTACSASSGAATPRSRRSILPRRRRPTTRRAWSTRRGSSTSSA